MSAGTLFLTNKNDAVIGTGTAFTTELSAGDFIVVTVGGVPYTLPIKSVDSATKLTLVSNYTGPTQSGAAWSAVPRVALNMVTAALVVQSAEALRGLNYDKQNWQQFFTADGDVTIKLPDNSQSTGPSAKKLQEQMADKVDKSQLGNSSGRDVFNDGVVGDDNQPVMTQTNIDYRKVKGYDQFSSYPLGVSAGLVTGSQLPQSGSADGSYWGMLHVRGWYDDSAGGSSFQIACNGSVIGYRGSFYSDPKWYLGRFYKFRTEANTWVDGNGFIKQSSPIINIFADGSFETNDESDGATVERTDIGVYKISGVLGLNADALWGGIDGGFEIPVDRNKQPRIWLDYKICPDGSVVIKTYHRINTSSPAFAQNRIGAYDASGAFTETVADGDPVDIPSDSYVTVRVQMPLSDEE